MPSPARLARDVVAERLELGGPRCRETRFDLIGMDALHGPALSSGEPYEVRLRVAARTATREEALRVAGEVESLYTNGPAGGGGAVKTVREVLAVASAFVPRERVVTRVGFLEA